VTDIPSVVTRLIKPFAMVVGWALDLTPEAALLNRGRVMRRKSWPKV
jgi:hypothetical protein